MAEEEKKNITISLSESVRAPLLEQAPALNSKDDKIGRTKVKNKKNKKGYSELHNKKLSSSSVKRLLLITVSFWKLFTSANLFLFISTSMQILIPLISGKLIDSISNGKDQESLEFYGYLFLGAFLINGLSTFLENFLFPVLTEKIAQKMRNDMFKHVIFNDIEFFDHNKTGDLLSRISSDITTVKLAAGSSLSEMIKSFSIFIVSFVVMFCISWRLSMIFLAVIPTLIFMTTIFTKKKKMYELQYQEHLADGTICAEEAFSSIRTVRSFAGEAKELKRFEKVTKSAFKTGFIKAVWGSIYYTGTRTIANSIKLIVFWYGGYLALEGLVTPGELVSFMLFTSMFSNNSRSIGKEMSSLVTAFAVSERIFEILDWQPRIKVDPALKIDVTNKTLKGNITFNQVCFSYSTKKEVTSLDKVNLEICSGEVVAFVGKSGSGKTTLVSLLQRFYDVSDGEILIDGMNIKHLDQDFLHQNIGYVSQDPLLFSGTIEENLTYGVKSYSLEELEKVTRLANAWDFINDQSAFPLGFKTFVGERGVQVSGGQKQRIAIARALLKNPKILILDEATSSLDSENENQVQSAIHSLIQQGNMTVLIIAHRLSTIMKCPRINVLANGKVVEEGSHSELIEKKGVYASLHSQN